MTSSAGQQETARLLDTLEAYSRKYIVMSDAQHIATAAWTMHTYCYTLRPVTPYLIVTSAEMRSGKTLLLDLLGQVVNRPISMVAPTEAVLFRVVNQEKPTMMIDETDAIFKEGRSGPSERQEGLRQIINSGYRRGMTVWRMALGNQYAEQFEIYCPKVLAGIGHLPETIEDRGLPIRLRRKLPSERVEEFFDEDAEVEMRETRRYLDGWGSYALLNLRRDRPDMPDQLDSRAKAAYALLVSICDLAGEEYGHRVRAALVALRCNHDTGEPSRGIRLLADLSLVDLSGYDRIPTADLLALLYENGEQPYEEWWGESTKPKAALRLSHLLREYDLRSEQWRSGDVRYRGYKAAAISAEVARYALQPVTPVTTADLQGFSEQPTRDKDPGLSRVENPANPHGEPFVTGVTGSTSGEAAAGKAAWLSPDAQAELGDFDNYP